MDDLRFKEIVRKVNEVKEQNFEYEVRDVIVFTDFENEDESIHIFLNTAFHSKKESEKDYKTRVSEMKNFDNEASKAFEIAKAYFEDSEHKVYVYRDLYNAIFYFKQGVVLVEDGSVIKNARIQSVRRILR